jgi:hypothetical protein
MGTSPHFPCPPAFRLWRAKPAFAHAIMGTSPHFPCPPAFRLWRAKPPFAYAIMGTRGGFAPPFGLRDLHLPHHTRSLRSASPYPP